MTNDSCQTGSHSFPMESCTGAAGSFRMRKIRIRFELWIRWNIWTSAARPYATGQPEVMYSNKNYEREARITNILTL